MKVSYDYSDLIEEIKEELEDGVLSTYDKILIERSSEPVNGKYKPIVDWFYLDDEEAPENAETLLVIAALLEMQTIDSVI